MPVLYRFSHLPLVTQGHVRFYAGTPLVSSKGHRLGTVCFACPTARTFDAEGCMMLTNMGELVTRELEREWAAEQQAKIHTSASSVRDPPPPLPPGAYTLYSVACEIAVFAASHPPFCQLFVMFPPPPHRQP